MPAELRRAVVSTGLAALLVGSFSVSQARAEGDPAPSAPGATETVERLPSVDANVTFASRYLFQGIDYSEGRTVVQPNVGAAYGAWSIGAWGNVQPDRNVLNEVDLTLKYTRETARGTVSTGYMVLRYPNRDWDPSQEVFLDLAPKAPLNPTLSLHYDVDAGTGLYATFGLSREVVAPLTLTTNLFYQDGYYGVTGVPAMEIRASASLPVGAFSITPSLSRFLTWTNGDFAGDVAPPSTWLFSVDVSRSLR